jgi:choline monooxygenase
VGFCPSAALAEPGSFVAREAAGTPIVAVRGRDGAVRAFLNACSHRGAQVACEPTGCASALVCPYHGWTYGLDGALKGTPDFAGVCEFDRGKNGLVPVRTEEWETFVFVRLDPDGPSLREDLGDLVAQFRPLGLDKLHFFERRIYKFDCNWKVFVDNYLDGGYHIPFLHKGLDSVLDYSSYTIENGARYCLQASPMETANAEAATGAVRKGEKALYYWIHPNFMVNWYEGIMDTNLVIPLGLDRTEVVFDFYFAGSDAERNRASVAIGERIQGEDTAICESVQRGLASRAYRAGRLSVRREAGEHLFHRLLHADLRKGI